MTSIEIVVPMYNSVGYIEGTLDSLLAQDLPATWERSIVVVDDASTDNGAELVEATYGGEIGLVRLPENIGRSCARNTGARFQHSDYLMFIDSDCVLIGNTALSSFIEELENGSDACFGQARARGNSFWSKYFNKVADDRVLRGKKGDYLALTSPIFIIQRNAYEKIGGFSERYRKYGFEDRDFIVRLEQGGATISFRPDVIVWHENNITIESMCQKMEEAGRFTSQLFASDHLEIYKRMSYSRVDARLYPLRAKLLMAFFGLPLPGLISAGDKAVKSRLIPISVKTMIVKILSALSYLAGTYRSDPD